MDAVLHANRPEALQGSDVTPQASRGVPAPGALKEEPTTKTPRHEGRTKNKTM